MKKSLKIMVAFMKKHMTALIVTAVIAALVASAGTIYAKYYTSVEAVGDLSLSIVMDSTGIEINQTNMWSVLNSLGFSSANISFVKSSDVPASATRQDTGGVQSSGQTGEIGVYYDSAAGNIYIAPVDNNNATIMAPANCANFFSKNSHSDMSKVKSLTFDNFDTSQVTSMSQMFYLCQLTSLDLSAFDTSSVTSFYMMFTASSLTELDLSSFDTAKVTSVTGMFMQCTSLKTIYASDKFVLSSGISDDGMMFRGCTLLVGGNGTAYNQNNVNKTYARIDADGTPGYFTGA